VQPKEAGVADEEPREVVVTRQAKEMLDKVPPHYDMYEVKERFVDSLPVLLYSTRSRFDKLKPAESEFPESAQGMICRRLHVMGHTQPMNIFLKQEIDRIQIVIELVRSMLGDLLLAIEGVIIMCEVIFSSNLPIFANWRSRNRLIPSANSQELRDALDNIYDARIPKIWKDHSWESATLGFWFTELLERNQQFSNWLLTGRPAKFWMTGFFNPQGDNRLPR
jgi:dynein heavy chain